MRSLRAVPGPWHYRLKLLGYEFSQAHLDADCRTVIFYCSTPTSAQPAGKKFFEQLDPIVSADNGDPG